MSRPDHDEAAREAPPADYAPGAVPDHGASRDVSAAKTDTSTADTDPVYDTDPGPTVGDTTGDDPHGADDVRDP